MLFRSATAVSLAIVVVAYRLEAAALGVDLGFVEAALLVAGTSLATAIPSGPGYLGSFELAAVAILAALGVATETALGVAILVHGVILAVTSAAGAVAALATWWIGRRARVAAPLPGPGAA